MTRAKTRAKKKAQQAPGGASLPEDAVQGNGNGVVNGQHHQQYHQQQQQQQYQQQHQHHHHNSQEYGHSQNHQYAHPHHHHAQPGVNGYPAQQHPHSHSPQSAHQHQHQHPQSRSDQTHADIQKKMVPISDKALAMLNHMLGNRGMMQRDPSTGAIDVVLNTELFPNLTLPFPALEIPSKGSGDPEEDIRDVLSKVAGGALGGIVGLPGMQPQGQGQQQQQQSQSQSQQQQQQQQQMIGNAMAAGLGVGPGGKLPNLEDLLKLPIFQTGSTENAPALSKYLFQPHPSSSAPYAVSPAQAQAQAQAHVQAMQQQQQQQLAAKRKNGQQPAPTSQSTAPPAATLPIPQSQAQALRSSATPNGRQHPSIMPVQHVDARLPPSGLVPAGSGSNSSSTEGMSQHMCPHCDEMHSSRAYTDEEYDEDDDEEYDSYYASEESFEYDGEEDDIEEEEDDEGLHPDDVSQLSRAPESYDEDEEDEEGVDGEVDTFSIGEIEDELGPGREDEREEAREFFSRVFGKGKEKQRQMDIPSSASQGGPMGGPGGDAQQQHQPHHVCGPDCREPTPRQLSEARLQKELFFEKMKVAFMYDGWPEELLKKKWSELTDQERDYIRRTVLARATDGPICEDEKSKARLMKKGWPESALNKRWSELTDTERKRILQVEAAAPPAPDDGPERVHGNAPSEAVPSQTNEAAMTQPPQMPGGWTGGAGTGGQTDPVLLSVGGTLMDDVNRADAEAFNDAIRQYGSVISPYTSANGQDKMSFPEITGPDGQAPALDEPTKAEVRKKLARFHAKATETAKWIMSHLETNGSIDPHLRDSLQEAKQVFEDFRTNFKVPDFLQEQMDVATIMYDDLNGTNLSHLPPGVDHGHHGHQVEDAPPTTNGTGDGKKKKKKQKKKKKRKSGAGGQQQGQGDEDGDGGNDDQEGSEEEAVPESASFLDNPENQDWACNELFQWIKAVVWSIEQDAIRAGRAAAVSKSNSNKKNKGGNKKAEEDAARNNIQITWNLPDQPGGQTDQTKGPGQAGTTITYTPTPAPDAEQLRARLRSVGVEVGPA